MQYREAVITYIDVLGFRELVERCDAADIDAVLRSFEGHAAPFFLAEATGLTYVAFSDLIVRVSPLERPMDRKELSDRVTTEMSDVAAAQTQLCQRGIVIRGAITAGKIAIEAGRVFGPGLVRAYTLESKVAKYPRVILDQEIVARLGLRSWLDDPAADGNDFPRWILEPCQYCARDTDGEVFVNYLEAMCDLGNDGTPEELAEEYILLEKHCRTTTEGLKSGSGRVRDKYLWLRDYHNRVVGPDHPTHIG